MSSIEPKGVADPMAATAAAAEVGDEAVAAALLECAGAGQDDIGVLGTLPGAVTDSLRAAGHRLRDAGDEQGAGRIEPQSLDALVVTGSGNTSDPLGVLELARKVLRHGGRLCVLGVFCRQAGTDGPAPAPLLDTWEALGERGGFESGRLRRLASPAAGRLEGIDSGGLVAQGGVGAIHQERGGPGCERVYLLQFALTAAARWIVTQAGAEDLPELERLFENVFGHVQSPAMWAWKYGGGGGHNLVVRSDGRMVAHCGGMVRRVSFFGRLCLAMELCDMMVAPEERGVLTRKGALFQVTAAMIDLYTGYGRPYLFAFGFPTGRHMRLGERLGLYRGATRITEHAWRPGAGVRVFTRVREFEPRNDGPLVDVLWSRMRRDLATSVALVRDWAYVQQRYLAHPQVRYQLFLVTGRFSGRPRGLIVLRLDDQRCQLVDLVGPLEAVPLLVGHARRIAARLGANELYTWISAEYSGRFDHGGVEQRSSELIVPVNLWTPAPKVEEFRGRMWVTAGDTDFR